MARPRGPGQNAVIMAVVGLVVVLLAKGIALALSSRLGPILPGTKTRTEERQMKPTMQTLKILTARLGKDRAGANRDMETARAVPEPPSRRRT